MSKTAIWMHSLVMYSIAAITLVAGIFDLTVHHWFEGAQFIMFAFVWVSIGSQVARAEARGWMRGRRQALEGALQLQRQGLGVEVVIDMDAALLVGAIHPCKECAHLVPTNRAVSPYHGDKCSLHTNNVADAQ